MMNMVACGLGQAAERQAGAERGCESRHRPHGDPGGATTRRRRRRGGGRGRQWKGGAQEGWIGRYLPEAFDRERRRWAPGGLPDGRAGGGIPRYLASASDALDPGRDWATGAQEVGLSVGVAPSIKVVLARERAGGGIDCA